MTFECKVVPRTSTSFGKTQLLPPSFAYNHPRVSHVVESYWLQESGPVVVIATSLMYIELKRNNNTAAGTILLPSAGITDVSPHSVGTITNTSDSGRSLTPVVCIAASIVHKPQYNNQWISRESGSFYFSSILLGFFILNMQCHTTAPSLLAQRSQDIGRETRRGGKWAVFLKFLWLGLYTATLKKVHTTTQTESLLSSEKHDDKNSRRPRRRKRKSNKKSMALCEHLSSSGRVLGRDMCYTLARRAH